MSVWWITETQKDPVSTCRTGYRVQTQVIECWVWWSTDWAPPTSLQDAPSPERRETWWWSRTRKQCCVSRVSRLSHQQNHPTGWPPALLCSRLQNFHHAPHHFLCFVWKHTREKRSNEFHHSGKILLRTNGTKLLHLLILWDQNNHHTEVWLID